MHFVRIFAFLVSITLFALPVFAEERLVFAIDIIRHGDRTPIHAIPTIHYHWPQGLGQLTATGMQQEYQLGAQKRQLYIDTYHLLPKYYQPGTMYVRSTNFDRTLMSADAFLLGLYPLGSGPMLPNKQGALPDRYQPIPIYTALATQPDNLVVETSSQQFQELANKFVLSTASWQEKEAQLQPKFAEWSKILGEPITNLRQLKSIADTLYICQLHHINLPNGLNKTDEKAIIAAGRWAAAQEFQPFALGQLAAKDIIKLLDQYLITASTQTDPLKYVLLSAHDSTLFSIMSSLKVPLDDVPPYASNLNLMLL